MNADLLALVAKEALRSRHHPQGRVANAEMADKIRQQLRDGSSQPDKHPPAARTTAWRAALVDVDDTAIAAALEQWRPAVVAGFESWDHTGVASPLCVAAAAIFPEEPRFIEQVQQRLPLLDFKGWSAWSAAPIVMAARSLEELRQLLVFVPAYLAADFLDPFTALAMFGAEALPVLQDLYTRAGGETLNPDKRRPGQMNPEAWARFLELFAMISTSPRLLKPLVVHGELTLLRPAQLRALQHQPRVLLQACLSTAGRPGLARDLAAVIVRRDPSTIDVATTDLQRGTVSSLLPPDAPVSSTSSLPVELQKPPWLGKKPGKGAVIDCLAAPTIAPQVRWRPGQHEAWASTPPWPNVDTAIENLCGVAGASMEAAIAHLVSRSASAWSHEGEHPQLSLLPEPLLRGMWTAFPVTAWHLDTATTRRLVARLGLDVVDGLLARAGLIDVAHTHTATGLMPRKTRLVAQSLDALQPVASLQVVPLVAVAIGQRDARRHALAWLDAHPAVAAAGLVPLALGAGPHRGGARAALHALAQHGHRSTVEAATTSFSPEVGAAVTALLDENPLVLAKAPKRAGWCVVSELAPVLTHSGARLDDTAVGLVVDALSVSTVDMSYAGLEAMTAALTTSSLAAMVWSLFRQWWLAGAPSADAWVLSALGHVGDERVAAGLVEQMTVWAGDGMAARAKTGVQVLTTLTNRYDAALLALFRFSKRAPTKGLSRAATDAIDTVALARGLSVEELADRLVPDLGLNDDGTTTIELGDRAITVSFDGLLRPVLLDADNKTLPSLPRLSSSMDAALHAEAKATLKQLTKAAGEVGSHMLRRLEGALAEQRRWPQNVAIAHVLHHPLLRHIARCLLWTDLGEAGDVLATFRVAEDGTFADVNDDLYALRGVNIGLAHPLLLSAAEVAQWRTVLTDYELHQPFAQLERAVFTVDDAQAEGAVSTRYVGQQVPTGRLFSLEVRGWQRGPGTATRRVDGVEATLQYAPGIFGGPEASKVPQTLGVVTLAGGRSWQSLSPLLCSELLHDLERLRP